MSFNNRLSSIINPATVVNIPTPKTNIAHATKTTMCVLVVTRTPADYQPVTQYENRFITDQR